MNKNKVNKAKYKAKGQDKVQEEQKKEVKKNKNEEERKVFKGVFIADQRRKGKGGRIKSTEFPNKIQVRMKRNIAYLHQSEVEWVEIRRYNRKQDKRNKKMEKKKLKFKQKVEEKKIEGKQMKQESKESKCDIEEKKTLDQKQVTPLKESNNKNLETSGENTEKQDTKQIPQKDEISEDSDSSSQSEKENEDENEGTEKKNQPTTESQRQRQQQEKKKQEQNDIVIVAEIVRQISNPFWGKTFVGVLEFQMIDRKPDKKPKYREQKSYVSQILDDNNVNFSPIHMRLPICYVEKNNNTERIFQKYVEDNVKIKQSDKGGKIRNNILDQLESTYALVKFVENYNGHIYVDVVKIIGKSRTIDGECNCFLYEHQLNDFQHSQTEQKTNFQIPLSISPLHKKFDQMVFTIDPITSTDLDDALSVRKLAEDEYQFGIHISDVSSYVDKIPRQEILKRTTSVYLPHYVYHMLPSNLVNICSLNPNVERLAFTIFVVMNTDGDILKSRIEKNVIKSRFKLAYEQAQRIITDEINYESFNEIHQCTKGQFQQLQEKIKVLQKIGMAHRRKRLVFQIFDNSQIKFELDQQKWPIAFTVNKRFTAQKIIQEFMIIGNIQSAKKIAELDQKNSLIIHHPNPSNLAIRQFNQYFADLKHQFKFEDSLSLQKDLLKVMGIEQISDQIKKVYTFKARKAQQTANYKRYSQVSSLQGNIHFALGLRFYTHFTSPMRRIADILVHELLNSVVDPNCKKKQLEQKQIEKANWGRKNTKRLKRDLNQIYFCLMMYKTKKVVKAQAIVLSFGGNSISIYIPLIDINKQVMWKDMKIHKANKSRKDEKKLEVVVYFDKKDARNDIIWTVEKFLKFEIVLDCSSQIPLRFIFQFNVKTNKGDKIIKPRDYY